MHFVSNLDIQKVVI